MKLTVIYADVFMVRCNMEFYGEKVLPKKRLVSIDLTDEQAELLRREVVGQSKGLDIKEDIIDIIIEEN